MSRPRLRDEFCGAGGAAWGYWLAGFDVVGVDLVDQPHYPFEFIRMDSIEDLTDPDWVGDFDAIHASPPCQAYSTATLHTPWMDYKEAVLAIPPAYTEFIGAQLMQQISVSGER